jgi:hypothetical protein
VNRHVPLALLRTAAQIDALCVTSRLQTSNSQLQTENWIIGTSRHVCRPYPTASRYSLQPTRSFCLHSVSLGENGDVDGALAEPDPTRGPSHSELVRFLILFVMHSVTGTQTWIAPKREQRIMQRLSSSQIFHFYFFYSSYVRCHNRHHHELKTFGHTACTVPSKTLFEPTSFSSTNTPFVRRQ